MRAWIGSAARKATHHCLPQLSDDTLMECNMLTQEIVQSLFSYDPETGLLTRNQRMSQMKSGSYAGTKNSNGYLYVSISYKIYAVHRLIWMYVYGHFPEKNVDHKNGIKHDNRLCNLRNATTSENNQNRRKYSNNKTGYKGVSIKKGRSINKYLAQIKVNGNVKHLGYFETPDLAHAAYRDAASKYHTHNDLN